MPDLPHFAYPFSFAAQPDGTVAARVVEQDTVEDLQACVARIVGTPVGSRDEVPGFGVTQLAFQQGDIAQGPLRSQLEQWEPRADLDSDEVIDALAPTLRTEQVVVARLPAKSG